MEYVVLGGTFDPVHNGHLKTAQELVTHMGYETLYLMPCANAYHKAGTQADAQHRVAMLELATSCSSASILQVDDRETHRKGATYTVDTLQELRTQLGEHAHIVWVMGTDAAKSLHHWHQWQRIFQLANVIVVARNGEAFTPEVSWPAIEQTSIKEFKGHSHGCYYTVALTPMDISSSDVRLALTSSKPVESHVPQVVLNYVEQHGLYQGNN